MPLARVIQIEICAEEVDEICCTPRMFAAAKIPATSRKKEAGLFRSVALNHMKRW